MKPNTKLPTWVFALTVIIVITVIILTAWQSLAILREIHQTSVEIAELSKNLPKAEQAKPSPSPKQTGFCGWSTKGSCSNDSECITGGCSGQVCQSKSEEPVITTCEYKDCYNDEAYGVECKCVNNTCQWQ